MSAFQHGLAWGALLGLLIGVVLTLVLVIDPIRFSEEVKNDDRT